MKNNLIIIFKNFVKRNTIISMVAGLSFVFFLGYFVGFDVGQDTLKEQELTSLEQIMGEKLTTNEPYFQISKDDDPILGDPNAPISIIEFSSYQCSFCARFYSDTLPLLDTQYIQTGKVNLIYRDFPIQKIYSNGMSASIASECADEQGKFWQYHDLLFTNQMNWKQLELDLAIFTFKQFATTLNLNQSEFDSCLDSGKYSDEVGKDQADGRNYLVSGTPTFFVGNEEAGYSSMFGAQSFSDFRIIIDEKLTQ